MSRTALLFAIAAFVPCIAGSDPAAAQPCTQLLVGTEGADQLRGSSAADRILGLGGNDMLAGLGSDDCIEGRDGDDLLMGGAGRDRLSGGDGNDKLIEAGDGYRPGLTIEVGSNVISAGPGNDAIDAANGRRDRVQCGPGRDRARADRIDALKGCERSTYLRSPFPSAQPGSTRNRKRSFMIEFRSLADTDGDIEFFSISVTGPGSCKEIVSNSVGTDFHRDRAVLYRLLPFKGAGTAAARWCPGLYRGKAEFIAITKAGCRVARTLKPDPTCTETRRIGVFSFRVR